MSLCAKSHNEVTYTKDALEERRFICVPDKPIEIKTQALPLDAPIVGYLFSYLFSIAIWLSDDCIKEEIWQFLKIIPHS